MTASTFNEAPGLPVLHSRDLVHWNLVGHALPTLTPEDHFDLPRHGCGVWAPSIRHHDGRFFIVYPDPDHGIFVVTAQDPRGPWSTPHLLLPGRGRIDPCPLWDDDGRAYLVHGWAATRAGFKNRLTLVEVDPDLRTVTGRSRTIIDGNDIPGWTTLEGPKFYRRDGWYWIFAPAGGVATGWQAVFRSRTVEGPYEHRMVLAQGNSPVNGPHQGAWVETEAGEHWFLHFQDRGPAGRVVHLQPMAWGEDGWPTMGLPGPNGVGEPVLTHPMPKVIGDAAPPVVAAWCTAPYGMDGFTGPLGPQWSWQANPRPGWVRLPGDGTLHLPAVAEDRGDLRELASVLGQRMPGHPCVVRAGVRLDGGGQPVPDGVRTGLVVLGSAYTWIGLEVVEGVCRLALRSGGWPEVFESGPVLDPPVEVREAHLRVTVDARFRARFAWSRDGLDWHDLATVPVKEGRWIGARLGLFTAAPVGTALEARDATGVFTPLEIISTTA